MEKVYVPFYNRDFDEGRGPMLPKPFAFKHPNQAQQYIDSKPGVQGIKGAGGGWEVKEFIVYLSASQAQAVDNDELRRKALNKLTSEEKQALGL